MANSQITRAIGSGSGSTVLGKHTADDIFVDINAKGPRDLLGDAGAAGPGIVALARRSGR